MLNFFILPCYFILHIITIPPPSLLLISKHMMMSKNSKGYGVLPGPYCRVC